MNLVISVYEDLGITTDLNEDDQEKYGKFIETELEKEYEGLSVYFENKQPPHFEKIEIESDDFEDNYQKRDEIVSEIGLSLAYLWDKWESR